MSKKVLVLNAGSSSLKYKLFQNSDGALEPLISGLAERIGETGASRLVSKTSNGGTAKSLVVEDAMADHKAALQFVMAQLKEVFSPKIVHEVKAVGHRVVHGGPDYSRAVVVNKEVEQAIHRAASLAPLHNPPNLSGIQAASALFNCPHVAVFDTAFHQTMPEQAFLYAIPYRIYQERAIRKYGFHGTSYKFLTEQAAAMLGKPQEHVNLIICHLGAGSSMCAVKGGVSIDTTMGVTPLEGLVMASRSGDTDPALPLMLQDMYGLKAKDVDNMLNKQSGLVGICGQKDMRAILEGMDRGDHLCRLAFDMFVYRVRKYLGAYTVALGGHVDAVVFSAGIGENAWRVRQPICEGLEALHIRMDANKNRQAVGGVQADVSDPGSKTKVLVIPTDEELSIAQQSLEAIAAANGTGK